MTKTFFEDYLARHRGHLPIKLITVSFLRHMTVAAYTWGHVIQTEFVDDEGITTLEVIKSWNTHDGVLLSRERLGEAHNEMRTYLRDSRYPVGAVVRLQ